MLRTDEHGKGSQKDMFESPTSVDQIINSRRLGTTRELARQAFDAYSPGVQKVYANYSDPRTEPVLLEWGLFHYNFTCVFSRACRLAFCDCTQLAGCAVAKAKTNVQPAN